MNKLARFVCRSSLIVGLLAGAGGSAKAADCEATIGKYMIGQALLAANYVAAAEKAGMKPAEINAALKDIAANSSIEEFWITDSSGRAYLTNTGIDFTFDRDPAKQPSFSLLAADRRHRDRRGPAGAEARDRQSRLQVCRRGRNRQAAHRAGRGRRRALARLRIGSVRTWLRGSPSPGACRAR